MTGEAVLTPRAFWMVLGSWGSWTELRTADPGGRAGGEGAGPTPALPLGRGQQAAAAWLWEAGDAVGSVWGTALSSG